MRVEKVTCNAERERDLRDCDRDVYGDTVRNYAATVTISRDGVTVVLTVTLT